PERLRRPGRVPVRDRSRGGHRLRESPHHLGGGSRLAGGLHPGLAPGEHTALREGRRDLAGPLCGGQLGGRFPSPPRRRRPVGEEGRQRRRRLLGFLDARSGNGTGDTHGAEWPPAGCRRGADRGRRTRPGLLREVDGIGRTAARVQHGGAVRRHGGGESGAERRAGRLRRAQAGRGDRGLIDQAIRAATTKLNTPKIWVRSWPSNPRASEAPIKVLMTPAKPITSPSRTLTLPAAKLTRLAASAVKMMTSREVPSAVCCSIPRRKTRAGTMITPPPTPATPAVTPETRPRRRAITQAVASSMPPPAPTSPPITMRVPATTRMTTKTARRTRGDIRPITRDPTVDPAIAPAATTRPRSQATSPEKANRIIPAEAMTRMANSEVACARCCATPTASIRGTSTMPPPTPNIPARKPAVMPMAANAQTEGIFSVVGSVTDGRVTADGRASFRPAIRG